jgi:hypothetical protein
MADFLVHDGGRHMVLLPPSSVPHASAVQVRAVLSANNNPAGAPAIRRELPFLLILAPVGSSSPCRRFHKQHHQFRRPNIFATEFAHPLEDVLVNMCGTLCGPLLLGTHPLVLVLYMCMKLYQSVSSVPRRSASFLSAALCWRLFFAVDCLPCIALRCAATRRTAAPPALTVPSPPRWLLPCAAPQMEAHSGYNLPFPLSVVSFIDSMDAAPAHDFHHSHNVGNYG